MKKKEDSLSKTLPSTAELLGRFSQEKSGSFKKIVVIVLAVFMALPALGLVISKINAKADADDSVNVALATVPAAITIPGKKDLISIPSGSVKSNPFMPYRNIGDADSVVEDVPKFDLLEPPDMIKEASDAARVMDTVVSGILYDKFSPSAILNIEGNDYLVKKGDVVNNYKVLNIMQDSVTVKLGNNTYKAGIGEVLTEGTINYNDVSNLSKKFGGDRR